MKAFFTKGIYRFSVAVLLLFSVVCASSCNFRKYIPKHSYLLGKVKIKGEPSAYSDEIYGLLKQTPNKKTLGIFRTNMWSYLWAKESNIKKRREKKLHRLEDELLEARNELRNIPEAETKKLENQEYKIVKLENKIDKQRDKVNNLTRGVFEEPVLFDSALTASSAAQIQAYLFNKGYFKNTVKYKVKTDSTNARIFYNKIRTALGLNYKKSRKAKVIYRVQHRAPYKINKIDYLVYDGLLLPLVMADSLKSLVQPGMRYDGDNLARERERLYILFRENGYFNFSREYIYYEVDSALKGRFVNVGLAIANPPNRAQHRIYKFNKIYIEPEYILGDSLKKDTIIYQDFNYLSNGLHIKPSFLSDFIFLHEDSLFRLSDYQSTLNRLSQLNLFRFVDIQFSLDTLNRRDTGLLSAYIRLTPLKKQEFYTDLELNSTEESQAGIATSNSRSLGLAGSVVYRNRNLFHNGLQLEIRPRGAIEIPITVLQDVRVIDTPSYEYGISGSLVFPQLLLPWKVKDQTLRLSSQTAYNLNFIFEKNRYFNRTTFNTNLTYQLKKGIYTHFVTPVEISLVNTGFNNSIFENEIRKTNDPLLINLFDQHIITDARYSFVIGQQPITNVASRYWFFRNSVEIGGNITALAELLFDNKEESGNHTRKIFGINYYQYFRNEADLRFYAPVWRENNIALRGIMGFGLPYGNSTILPFERRFYVGGSNSIRAWRLRELGPGQYRDNNAVAFDKSGDLKLEGSAEFRFPIYGLFKSALFVDAGNVWTYKEDKARPGAQFKTDSFYRQFAVGAGLGFRFDFTFFVLRLDLALPVRNPAMPVGERYVLHNIRSFPWVRDNIQLSLGIGYPF